MLKSMIRKNKRALIIVVAIILLCVLFFLLCRTLNLNQTNTTLSQVEKQSDVILLGVLTQRVDEVNETSEDEASLLSYTGEFEIHKIFVNNTDRPIAENGSISIKETERLLPIPDQERAYYISGYMKMKENQKYLLFLDYSNDENLFTPVENGKVPVNNTEIINSLEEEENVSKADSETIKNQLQIADDARKKYL